MIRVETIRLPAFLASALVNGDCSSFDNGTKEQAAEDMAMLEAVEKFIAPGRVVGTVDDSEEEFAMIYVAGKPFSGGVISYVVHYDETEVTK